jgi:hypothetical protein
MVQDLIRENATGVLVCGLVVDDEEFVAKVVQTLALFFRNSWKDEYGDDVVVQQWLEADGYEYLMQMSETFDGSPEFMEHLALLCDILDEKDTAGEKDDE